MGVPLVKRRKPRLVWRAVLKINYHLINELLRACKKYGRDSPEAKKIRKKIGIAEPQRVERKENAKEVE